MRKPGLKKSYDLLKFAQSIFGNIMIIANSSIELALFYVVYMLIYTITQSLQQSCKGGAIITPFYRCRNSGKERINDLSKLINSRRGIQT